MKNSFFNSRNSSNTINDNHRATWNFQYNNSLTSNLLDTTSPLPSKSSKDRFSDETKSNTNSSVFNTPSVKRRTYSRIRTTIENNPDVEKLKLNFVLLRKNIERLDSIINESPIIIKKTKQKYKVPLKKLNISNIHIKENKPSSKFVSNSESERKKKAFLKAMKKREENNINNKISSFNFDYPVCLTEGNTKNEKQQKIISSEYKNNNKSSFYIPSKQTNLNYVITNKQKRMKI